MCGRGRGGGETGVVSNAAPASSSSSSGGAARTGSSGECNGSSRVDNKRKADGEHLEDPERENGKLMRTEGNKRKTVQEEEESS